MENKVALVVGGAKGIGLAIATRLAEEGAVVFLTGRNATEVVAAAATIGHDARGLVADAGVPADVESAVAAVQKDYGRLDALVLNAGMSEAASLGDETVGQFNDHFAVNVRSAVFGLQVALPLLGEGASVVLVGSIAGSAGAANYGTYAASKAALRSYARSWTAELAPRGIRVNVVSPGPTATAMFEAVPDEVKATIVSQIPMGRMAQPREVAAAALFLLSDEASFVAGVELCVDGGAKQV